MGTVLGRSLRIEDMTPDEARKELVSVMDWGTAPATAVSAVIEKLLSGCGTGGIRFDHVRRDHRHPAAHIPSVGRRPRRRIPGARQPGSVVECSFDGLQPKSWLRHAFREEATEERKGSASQRHRTGQRAGQVRNKAQVGLRINVDEVANDRFRLPVDTASNRMRCLSGNAECYTLTTAPIVRIAAISFPSNCFWRDFTHGA